MYQPDKDLKHLFRFSDSTTCKMSVLENVDTSPFLFQRLQLPRHVLTNPNPGSRILKAKESVNTRLFESKNPIKCYFTIKLANLSNVLLDDHIHINKFKIDGGGFHNDPETQKQLINVQAPDINVAIKIEEHVKFNRMVLE